MEVEQLFMSIKIKFPECKYSMNGKLRERNLVQKCVNSSIIKLYWMVTNNSCPCTL